MTLQEVVTPGGQRLYFLGPSLEEGTLPAFFYFSLAGDESLTLAPYNHPVLSLQDSRLRIFSVTLPCHGEGFDKFQALSCWARGCLEHSLLLERFLEQTHETIQWLLASGAIDPEHLGVGGLSRGGWVATHVAAKEKRIRFVLGFAPLTALSLHKDFAQCDPAYVASLDCLALVDELLHLHHLRFYIGNRDQTISTDACYRFIRTLAERAHIERKRNCLVEMTLTPSIGFEGHGTSDATFNEGALWMKDLLLRSS